MIENSRNTFKPPLSAQTMTWVQALPRWYFKPTFFGLDNVNPDKPHLYVGNHTIYGALDIPLYIVSLYKEKGVFLRGLGDHFHYQVPGWWRFLEAFGVVEGTRDNCAKLMEAGEDILVFPGGGREVCRRKGELHSLIWKERTGFAKLAVEYGYPIMPVASLGPDYAFSIMVDGQDMMESLPGKILNRIPGFNKLVRDGEGLPPIARGLGLTALPRPERFYCAFGKPIETASFAGMEDNLETLLDIRDQTATSINSMLARLKQYRKNDPGRGLIRKLVSRL